MSLNASFVHKFKHMSKNKIVSLTKRKETYKVKKNIVTSTSQGNNVIKFKQEPIENIEIKSEDVQIHKDTTPSCKIKREHIKLELDDDKDKAASSKQFKQEVWQPPNWENNLGSLRTMRQNKDAPVDSMGCDKCVDPFASTKVQRFHHLVSLMLSSQTKDQITYAAVKRLINKLDGLTVKSIQNIPEVDLISMLHPVGFYKTKAKYLKATANILQKEYDSDIPKTVKGLCSLPGVGPKMAHICMLTAWGETTGIGVDTHVHRIVNRLGWVLKPTKTPENTRMALEDWLPKKLWAEVNHLLVGFGQTICLPIKPKCHECLIKNVCPFGSKC